MKHQKEKTSVNNKTRKLFIAFLSVFVAVALGLTCALCFTGGAPQSGGDNVDTVEIDTSATYGNLTGDYSGVNKLAAGDIINYSYAANNNYSIKLPKGTFTFEVWGAQGGGGYQNGTFAAGTGLGGYAKGTVTLTTATTFYIVVGGQGTNGLLKKYGASSVAAGGYNGGGNSGQETNSDANDEGGGGGGATHIALVSGLLKNLSGNKNNIVIVAGGGGGTSFNRVAGKGHGGGATGGAGYSGTTVAGGGTQTAGGTRGTSTENSSASGTAGGFGYGGNGGNGTSGGGGGGGGWYGGGGAGVGANGGGGSGYTGGVSGVTPVVPLTGATMSNGSRSGHGYARITAVKLNDAPVTNNTNGTTPVAVTNTASNYYRGTSRNLTINANTIARDPDPVNTTAGTGGTANVYFTNNTATNLDTVPAANNGLWLNAACTVSASTYLYDWSWSANTLTIGTIKRYPKAGETGCSSDGVLTLYTRVRDNYYSNTQRGVAVIPFTLKINDYAIASNSYATTQRFSKSGYEYRMRNTPTHTNSTLSIANARLRDFTANTNDVYNPANSGKTVFISTPLTSSTPAGFTVYASDLYSDSDSNTTYGDLVGFKGVTLISGYSGYVAPTNYYSITYNTTSAYNSGLSQSITIKPTSVRPNGSVFVCLTLTAQSCDRQGKALTGSENKDVTLVFQIANTRPYYASTTGKVTSLTEPVVTLTHNGSSTDSATIDITQLVFDTDETSNSYRSTATFARGASDLKIPTNEYVQVNRGNTVIALAASSNYATYNTQSCVVSNSYTSGEGNTATNFNKDLVAMAGSAAANTASVVYSYDSATRIRFTSRAATHYQYGGENRKGDFYILVRIIDPSDTTDTGLWFPIAIKVNSAAPNELSPIANFTIGFNTFTPPSETSIDAQQGSKDKEGIVLTPISYVDSSGVVRGIGTTDKSFNGGGATHAQPFLRDPDTIMYTGKSVVQTNPLSDFAVLNGTTEATVLNMYEASSFFTVELVPLYAARSVFERLEMTYDQLSNLGITSFTGDGSASGYSFYGLKITPLRSTDNRYFQFDVKVKDTHATTKTVRVYVNVQNRAVQLRNDPSATSNYKINTMTGVGKYGYNSSLGMNVVNYSIEKDDVIQITPYDLAYDFDVDPSTINALNKSTLNTNPKDGAAFDTAAKNVILKQYSVYSVTTAGATTSAKTNQLGQQLVFANVDNFKTSAAQYASYISVDVKNTTVMNGTSYNIPCIEITGNSRTTTAVVQLRFTISDGYTSVNAVVTVTVNNSAPTINDEAHNPEKYQMKPYYTMTADTTDRYNSYMFTATEMLYDKDNDSPSFVTGSVRIVAYDADGDDKDKLDEDGNKIEYYSYLYYDTTASTYRGTNDADKAEYNLSDYIYSALTKNESGADVVYVKGLSSTQLFDKKIYVEVTAQDGFRTQPKTGIIHVLLDVTNSAPRMVADGLTETTDNKYSWLITYDDISEVKMSRYIFNSKELAQSQPISDSNKIWLFDDYDAQQSAIFYPSEWKKSDTDANWGKNLIYQTSSDITASSFTSSGQAGYNAAVIYNPTYPNASSNQYLTLVLHFYEKNEDGEFEEKSSIIGSENDIKKARYWALEIQDPVGLTSAQSTHIAIAVKDDHFGNKVYTSADKSTFNANGTTTSLRVLNFYYQYAKPGVMAMHTYYRTDGNSEAKTKLNDTDYVLDIRGLPEYANRGYLFADKNNPPQDQTGLQKAVFADDFKYQYFVKRVTDGSGAVIKTTYKHYPTSSNLAFYYRPIEVSSDAFNGGSATVPMSYIAMPQSISGGTDGENYHVTFANAKLTQTTGYLYDNAYWNWDNDLVLQNVTLSDGVNSWTGATELAKNPYVNISYTYDKNRKYLDTKYRNTKMGTLEMPSEGSEKYNFKICEESDLLDGSGASIYREDKYGFQISKKVSETSHRSTGMLKLTVAVKTLATSQEDNSAIEYVDVEIDLKNSKPGGTVFQSGYINNLAVSMTTADASGKTVSLVKSGEKETGDYNIIYTDPDTTDTMKFLLASAMDNKKGDVMSRAFIDHAKNTNFNSGNASGTATDIYFGNVTGDARYTYTPNPGYEEFFSVSPSDGAASTLQFIPKAKTQVNLTGDELQAYMNDHNLLKDDGGNIYYPFRILFYDEVSGSPFTDGYWVSAMIKVYIGNDIISVVKSDNILSEYKTTDSKYTKYNGSAMFSFKLSKSVDYFVDVTSLLVDNDIRIDKNGSYVTSEAGITDEIDGNQVVSVTEDYLKMPSKYGDEIIKRPGNADAELPVDIKIGGDNISDSTMVFSAKCAFKSSIVIAYTFKDSGGSSVVIIFSIGYNDEAPTANKDTYSAGAINITMKTGDSFTLYAADSTLFTNDALGGYQSTAWLNNVKFPSSDNQMTAAEMYEDFFGEETAREPGSGYLGSLIVGSDDVASTLRFLSYSGSSAFKTAGDEYCFEVTAGTQYLREDQPTAQANRRPMAVTVKAIGVVSTTYTVTLMDGGGEDGKYKQVSVSVNITVISSPPAAQTDSSKLPEGLTKVDDKDNTYALTLKYGDSPAKFYLKDFMVDDDEKDDEGFTVYTGTDGTKFNIVNPAGVSAVSASTDTYLNNERIVLSATDYIDKAGEDGIVTVSFRIADAHGTVSGLITFEITVLPSTVTTVATQANPNSITLKSFAEYVKNGEAVSVSLVEAGANAKMFRDADAAAGSSKYNVTVYALLNKNESGTFQTVALAQINKENNKLLSLKDGKREEIDSDNEIVSYVSRFFTIDISDDGKTLYFTPNSATIPTSGVKLEDIRLYIELSKRYTDGDKTALKVDDGYLYVSVANSALVAVKDSALNSGYPTTAEGYMREEEFLTFTGTAGDSLTWDLCNTLDPELGLFYDYDMINNPAIMNSGVNIGGRETIKYIRSEYSVIEQGISGKGDVLSISVVDGKLTIKINRKVYIGGIPPYKEDKKSTTIDVKIYCADTLGDRSSPKTEIFTTIKVVVENDLPKIKTVTNQTDIDKLGYSITTYSANSVDRYVLNSKLEKGKALAVNIRDIIEDADIDMDAYALLFTGSEASLMSSDGRTLNNDGKITSGASTLLTVNLIERENSYNTTTLSQIVFTCVSAERGAVATCELMFRDSIENTKTSILEVNITIDNIAPEAKKDVSTAITVMGVRYFDSETKDSAEAIAETKKAAVTRNILDFVTDQNGDDFDANDAANKDRRPTYVFIDEITVYTLEDIVNRPTIYGAGVVTDITDMNYTSAVCGIGWDDNDSKHQTFTITPVPGVYGKQIVSLTVIDSGYEDGDAEGILDGKAYSITVTITVANPLTDLDDVLETAQIAYGVTRSFTAADLLGEQNSQGYAIAAIEETGSNSFTVFKPGESQSVMTSATTATSTENWRVYARTEGARSDFKVVFKAGEVEVQKTLPIWTITNTAPTEINGKTTYEYTKSRLTKTNSGSYIIKIYPEEWFGDNDTDDIMSFVGPIESSQKVKVEAMLDYDDDGRSFILLTFNRRGEADISFNVTDLSGKLYNKKITVNCTDADEMSWWENFVSLIEANWLWFWIILASVLLFIIFLIILIVVVCKKRRMRREIEALLNSETELEEEMMRLSAGVGMNPYQSFGYLPPTQQAFNPNLMLGGGATAPVPNSLQLNAGVGAPPVGTQTQIPPVQSMGAPVNPAPNAGAQVPPQQPPVAPQQPQQPVQPPRPQQQAQAPITPPPPPASSDGFDPNDF